MIPKPIDPHSTTTAIWSGDPAIDQAGVKEFANTKEVHDFFSNPSRWKERYPLNDGVQPTIFVIGVIPATRLNELEDLYGSLDSRTNRRLYWECFVESLRDVLNVPHGKVPTKQRRGIAYVDPEWITETFDGPLRLIAHEMGLAAYRWNNGQELDLKN